MRVGEPRREIRLTLGDQRPRKRSPAYCGRGQCRRGLRIRNQDRLSSAADCGSIADLKYKERANVSVWDILGEGMPGHPPRVNA